MYIPVLSHLNGSHIKSNAVSERCFAKKLFCKILSCKIAVIEMLKRYLWKNKIKFWLIRTVKHILLTIYN